MANLPDSLYEDYSKLKLTCPSTPDTNTIIQWISDFHNEISFISNSALENLIFHRNDCEILPLLLWKYPCTVTMMLQEIENMGRRISLPVHPQQGMPVRVYNILLLFQCIAEHRETRGYFLKAKMPLSFFPLMDINLTNKPLECIRLGALGVIAHMLKAPVDRAAVRFIMDTGALHFCTKAIEIGSTESKTVAVFILNKILSTDEGLQYCCVLADRFFLIDCLLKNLLVYLSSMAKPSSSLFNLVAGCYAKLSQKSRARNVLRRSPPVMLLNGAFASLLAEDPAADNYRMQLLQNLG